MSGSVAKLDLLLNSYHKFIAIPWRDDAAAGQRVIFTVYNETDERILRARIGEFEIVTTQSGHKWFAFDFTDTFARWMSSQKYAQRYFENPDHLAALLPRYLDYLDDQFTDFLAANPIDERTVVSLIGVGSLFSFVKIKDVVDRFAPKVPGRLVVMFPGSYENNNYRLLDGYDGWNYLAVPITADKDY